LARGIVRLSPAHLKREKMEDEERVERARKKEKARSGKDG
jgi:hypothetical protein